jgi:hypothetical protein
MILRGDSQRERVREWRRQERQRMAQERATQRRVGAILRDWATQAADAAAQGHDLGRLASEQGGRLRQALLAVWRSQAAQGAGDVNAEVGHLRQAKAEDVPIAEDIIRRYADRRTNEIVRSFANDINRRLADAVAAGEGQQAAGQGIRDLTDIAVSRAARIARTETHAAYQAGSQAQAQELADTGVPMLKIWIAADDARTRDSHRNADGQTVPIDGHFTVGGQQLKHPGDPSGSAGEVINCRCAMGYRVARKPTAPAIDTAIRPAGLPPPANGDIEGRPLIALPDTAPEWIRDLPDPGPTRGNAVRQTELMVATRKTERAVLFDARGRIVAQAEGDAMSAPFPIHPKGTALTHNHPWYDLDGAEAGRKWYNPLSGGFDESGRFVGDAAVLTHYRLRYIRAVTPNGLVYEASQMRGRRLTTEALAKKWEEAHNAVRDQALAVAKSLGVPVGQANLILTDHIWRWLDRNRVVHYRVMRYGGKRTKSATRTRIVSGERASFEHKADLYRDMPIIDDRQPSPSEMERGTRAFAEYLYANDRDRYNSFIANFPDYAVDVSHTRNTPPLT